MKHKTHVHAINALVRQRYCFANPMHKPRIGMVPGRQLEQVGRRVKPPNSFDADCPKKRDAAAAAAAQIENTVRTC